MKCWTGQQGGDHSALSIGPNASVQYSTVSTVRQNLGLFKFHQYLVNNNK